MQRFLFPKEHYAKAIELVQKYPDLLQWSLQQAVYTPTIICRMDHGHGILCSSYRCAFEVYADIKDSELCVELLLLEARFAEKDTYFLTEGLLTALLAQGGVSFLKEGSLQNLWGVLLNGGGYQFEEGGSLEKARGILQWGGSLSEYGGGHNLKAARTFAKRKYSSGLEGLAFLLETHARCHPALRGRYLGDVGAVLNRVQVNVLGCTPCSGWGHIQFRIVGYAGECRVTWMSRQPRGIGRTAIIAGRVHMHSNAECETETVLRGVKDVE